DAFRAALLVDVVEAHPFAISAAQAHTLAVDDVVAARHHDPRLPRVRRVQLYVAAGLDQALATQALAVARMLAHVFDGPLRAVDSALAGLDERAELRRHNRCRHLIGQRLVLSFL